MPAHGTTTINHPKLKAEIEMPECEVALSCWMIGSIASCPHILYVCTALLNSSSCQVSSSGSATYIVIACS